MFRFEKHSTPPNLEVSTNCTPTVASESRDGIPPSSSQVSFSKTPETREAPNLMEDVGSMYFTKSAQEKIEEIVPRGENFLSLLYQPPLDDCTREMTQLNSLRYYIQESPAIIWSWYELFPNITDQIFSVSLGSDSLRHSLLAITAVIRDLFSNSTVNELYLVEKSVTTITSRSDFK